MARCPAGTPSRHPGGGFSAAVSPSAHPAGAQGVNAAARGAGHLVRLSNIGPLRNLAQKINDFMGGRNCIAEGHPVDVVSGTLFTEATDFTLYSAQEVAFRRFYNSRTEALPFDGNDLGPNWHHTLDHILIADETEDGRRTLTLRDDEGRVIGFEHPSADGEESFNAFERLTLTRVDGRTYEIRDLDHTVRVFRFPGGEGQKASESYAFWVELDVQPGLTTATDGLGGVTLYQFDQAINKVTQITDAEGGVRQMAYTDDGWLTSETDGVGHTTEYGHDERGRITEVIDANGNPTGAAASPRPSPTTR